MLKKDKAIKEKVIEMKENEEKHKSTFAGQLYSACLLGRMIINEITKCPKYKHGFNWEYIYNEKKYLFTIANTNGNEITVSVTLFAGETPFVVATKIVTYNEVPFTFEDGLDASIQNSIDSIYLNLLAEIENKRNKNKTLTNQEKIEIIKKIDGEYRQ